MWSIEFRPTKLEDFIGNRDVVERVRRFLQLGKFPKVSIFCGDSGTGKTTLAYIVANLLDAEVYEYNVADVRGIDTIREVIELCKYETITGRKRLFIFDEAHRFTRDAQEAMLKLLEGKDNKNLFILCTTEVDKLIPTIRNRAKVFVFTSISFDECVLLAKKLKQFFNRKEDWDTEVLMEVWRLCKGIPRLIVNVLEEVKAKEDVLRVFNKHALSAFEDDDFIYLAESIASKRFSWQDLRVRLSGKDREELALLLKRLKSYFLSLLLSCEGENERWEWYLYVLDRLSKVREDDGVGCVVGLCKLLLEDK